MARWLYQRKTLSDGSETSTWFLPHVAAVNELETSYRIKRPADGSAAIISPHRIDMTARRKALEHGGEKGAARIEAAFRKRNAALVWYEKSIEPQAPAPVSAEILPYRRAAWA